MSASFNGTTDYLTFLLSTALNGKAGATFTAWFNGPATTTVDEGILTLSIGTTAGSVNTRFRMQIENATLGRPLRSQGRNGTDTGTLLNQDGTVAIAINTWTFLAVTIDLTGTDVTTHYIDGVQTDQFTNLYTQTAWPATNSETGTIAAQNSTGVLPITGKLADIRVYDRPLLAVEIKNLFISRGSDGNRYGLQHQWQMNELNPTAALTAPKDGGVALKNPTVVGTPAYAAHPIRTRRAYY